MDDRLKLAENMLEEANKYIQGGDVIQSSEKIYKGAEECIKLLAEKQKLPEYDEAMKEGRWWSKLITKAASNLVKKLKEDRIEEAWKSAFYLHIWGFHEYAIGVEEVTRGISSVEWLLDYTRKALNTKLEGNR